MPEVIEKISQDSEARSYASNLVFTIWAVFGGFILHFMLSNYLTVLLRPSYEEPVETVADLINRDITPFFSPGGENLKQVLAASSDPNYQEISQRLYIAEDWDEHDDMVRKVTSTGLFASIGSRPDAWIVPEEEYKNWYRSSQPIAGDFPFVVHLANKKWQLNKVNS